MSTTAFGASHPVHPVIAQVFSPERRNAARNIVHSGWLDLEEKPKTYAKRFVALRDDNRLYYYEKDISKSTTCKPIGSINMSQVHRVYSESIKRRKYLIVIENREAVTYTFRVKNESTMKEWLGVLHRCQRRAAPPPKAYSAAGHVRARSGELDIPSGPILPDEPSTSRSSASKFSRDGTEKSFKEDSKQGNHDEETDVSFSSSPVFFRTSLYKKTKIPMKLNLSRQRSHSLGHLPQTGTPEVRVTNENEIFGKRSKSPRRSYESRSASSSVTEENREKTRAITLKHIMGGGGVTGIHATSGGEYSMRKRSRSRKLPRRALTDTPPAERSELRRYLGARRKNNRPRARSASPKPLDRSGGIASKEHKKSKVPPPLPPKRHSVMVDPNGTYKISALDDNKTKNRQQNISSTLPTTKEENFGAKQNERLSNFSKALQNQNSKEQNERSDEFAMSDLSFPKNFVEDDEPKIHYDNLGDDLDDEKDIVGSPNDPVLPTISEPPPAELPPPHYMVFPGAPKKKPQRKSHSRAVSDGSFALSSGGKNENSNSSSSYRRSMFDSRHTSALSKGRMITEREVGIFRSQISEFETQSKTAIEQGDLQRSEFYEKKIDILKDKISLYEQRKELGEVPFDYEAVDEGIKTLNQNLDDAFKKKNQVEMLRIHHLIEKLKRSRQNFDISSSNEEKREINEEVRLHLTSVHLNSLSSQPVENEIKRLNKILEWANANRKPQLSIQVWGWIQKLEKQQKLLKTAPSQAERQKHTIDLSQLVTDSSRAIKNPATNTN